MRFNFAAVPRIVLWTALGIATVALLTIITVQIMSIVMLTRPPTLTRWLNGLFAISSQAIFASIALAIAGFALHSTRNGADAVTVPTTAATSRPTLTAIAATPAATVSSRTLEPEPKIPASLQAAIAAANNPKKRGE